VNYDLEFMNMPLAVYREVVAHVRQVEGVTAQLLPQRATTFDYTQSQVGGLTLGHSDPSPDICQRLGQILAYYGDRYPLRDPSCLQQIQQTAQALNPAQGRETDPAAP